MDLKTIHNWVGARHLVGRRTEGRHLRFDRVEIVRFMRAFGYPIPPDVVRPAPTVLQVEADGARARGGAPVTLACGAFDAAFQLGSGQFEVAVVDLLALPGRSLERWCAAVRGGSGAPLIGLVGVSPQRARRRAFLRAGGSLAVASARRQAVPAAIAWLLGGRTRMPAGVEDLSVPTDD